MANVEAVFGARRACKCLKVLAPQVGLEPTTLRLTAECSTIELLRSKFGGLSHYNKARLFCQRSHSLAVVSFSQRIDAQDHPRVQIPARSEGTPPSFARPHRRDRRHSTRAPRGTLPRPPHHNRTRVRHPSSASFQANRHSLTSDLDANRSGGRAPLRA